MDFGIHIVDVEGGWAAWIWMQRWRRKRRRCSSTLFLAFVDL
jgi:hypothetical protein